MPKIELNVGLQTNGIENTEANRDVLLQQAMFLLRPWSPLTARYKTTYAGPDGLIEEHGLYVSFDIDHPVNVMGLIARIAELLGQECIALHCDELGGGHLLGPSAHRWGAFNSELFVRLDGKTLPASTSPGVTVVREWNRHDVHAIAARQFPELLAA